MLFACGLAFLPLGLLSAVRPQLRGPSWEHPLGQDRLGRDELSRLLAGARLSLGVGLSVVGVSLVIGLLIGGLAGWGGSVMPA